MLRGLYTASTALEQANRSMDVVANNLANINTNGYKSDIQIYEEFKSQLMYRIGGSLADGADTAPEVKTTAKGETYTLESKEGFFRIAAVNGMSYNKSISLRRDNDGYLKTFYRNSNGSIIEGKGYKVLGRNGFIKVDDGQKIDFDKSGNLLVDGEIKDNLIFERPMGVIGTMSGGAKLMRTSVDFAQGDFITTHNPLDLAISGGGFFVVKTPAGLRYTRDGQFKLDQSGTLMTDEGYEVQGINGKITGLKGEIGINEFAEISAGGTIVDKIQTVEPKRDEFLKKAGDNLYRYETDVNEEEKQISGSVVQGVLEGSNVNSVKEMVKMIETYRAYESAQRVVRAYDDSLAKTVNDIARV